MRSRDATGLKVDWRYRLLKIIAAIEKEDADVAVLQEYYDEAFARAIIDHFMGSESGLMIFSKAAIHSFSYTALGKTESSPSETIDYISLYQEETAQQITLTDCRLVPAFQKDCYTQTAWSDHHSLVLTVNGL